MKHRTLSARAYRLVILTPWILSILASIFTVFLLHFVSVVGLFFGLCLYGLSIVLIICGLNIGIWRRFQQKTVPHLHCLFLLWLWVLGRLQSLTTWQTFLNTKCLTTFSLYLFLCIFPTPLSILSYTHYEFPSLNKPWINVVSQGRKWGEAKKI